MAGKKKTATEITRRRELVSQYLLQEMTPAQIVEAIGPEVGDLRTVQRDIAEIQKLWNEDAKVAPDREDARRELIRKARATEQQAWLVAAKNGSVAEKTGAIRTAIKAQERLAKLQGLDIDRVEGTITLVTMNRVLEQLGDEVVRAVSEVIPDEATRAAVLDAVQERWSKLNLELGGPGS